MTVALPAVSQTEVVVGPRRGQRAVRMLVVRLAVIVAVVLLWWLLASLHLMSVGILASPGSVAHALSGAWHELLNQLSTTVVEILVALGIAWFGGIVLGTVVGGVRVLWPALGLARTAYAIPIIILYPILTVWFGYGSSSKVVFGVLAGLIPMLLLCASTITTVDRNVIVLLRSLGASRTELVCKGIIPASLPGLIVALRLSGSLVLVSVVVGEMLVSTRGLGFWIANSASLFDTPRVYLGIAVVIALAAILHTMVDFLEMSLSQYTTHTSN